MVLLVIYTHLNFIQQLSGESLKSRLGNVSLQCIFWYVVLAISGKQKGIWKEKMKGEKRRRNEMNELAYNNLLKTLIKRWNYLKNSFEAAN